MAEDRKPLADELGIPFYGQLMGMATGTEEDLYDAAYISRQYGLESEFKDEDRTSDSLRHILLGGLVYGDDSKESILGQAGRGIAGALADFREGDTPEDLIDLNNNEFGRKLREKYPDREEFITKAKEIADALYVDGELPEIDGLTPQKSYGAFETPENLAKFEKENKKQVMEIGPDGTWQFTDEAKKEREAAGLNQGGLMDDPLILSETAEEGDNSVLEDLYKTLPTNVRLYGEFMAGKDNLITEEDFSQEELELIKSLIQEQQKENEGLENYIRSFAEQGSPLKKRTRFVYADPTSDKPDLVEEEYYTNYKGQEFHPDEVDNELLKKETERLKTAIDSFDTTRNKTSIKSYYDREVASPGFLSTLKKLGDPRYNVQTSLGEFTAVEEEDGSIRIDDTYNFNPEEFSREDIDADLLIQNLTNPQNLMELLARKFKGDSSRDIQIKIPPKEMDRGGLMAADEVLIDEIISGLPKEDPFKSRQDPEYERPPVRPVPEDFDPESILQEIFPDNIKDYEQKYPAEENPESQYSSEEVGAMDKELDQAFADFENSRGSAADRDVYRKRVQEIYSSNPDLFRSQFQDKNTDQLIEMYNELDFSDEEVPFDDEIAEAAKYRATVPFGSEDDSTLGGGEIFNLSIGRRGTVSGKSRRYDDGVSEVFTPGGADKDKRDNILRHEGLHSLTEHEDVRELLAVYPNELLVRAYDVLRGVASGNNEWAEEALKFIEKAYKGKYGKSDIRLILSKLMPLLKEKAAEMSEGGLMADPLMLSETAEEEAEPKMGIGEYIEGAKELATDFSPAGTAQAMIDAAEEAYKLATGAEDASLLDFGIAAIGAIPGGKTATKVVDNASKIADEIAEASLEISKLDNYVPKKTVTAYKLFTKGEDGNLYPLFVDANKPLPVGEWIKANMPDYIFQAKNGRYYVPSKATAPKTETGKKAFYDTGERKATGSSVEIPDDPALRKKLVEAGFIAKEDTKSVKAVAARPGWHSGDVPIAHHIGAMIDPATGGTKKMEMPNVRRDDQVWAEVELPADVDWQQEALRRANVKKDGNIDVGTAHITDRVPHGGSYRYKTNPNMTGEWLIAGELKINRVLDDAEVKAINNAAGVEDLPRYSEFMDQYVKPKTEMSAGGLMKDDYNRAES